MSDVSSNTTSSDSAPHKTGKKQRWTIQAAIIMLIIGFVVLPVIAEIILSTVPMLLGWSNTRSQDWLLNSPTANFLFVLLAEGGTVALLAWYILRKKVSLRGALALNTPKWRDAAYTIGGIITYFVLFVAAFTLVDAVLPLNTDQEQAIGFERGVAGAGLAMAFVSLVIIPPIAEEIIFRGFFYGTLRRHKLRIRWSVFITSAVFAALHLLGSADGGLLWIAFLDTFVLSIVLCYVREKTGSLWASIGVHALKNGFVFLNLFILNVV